MCQIRGRGGYSLLFLFPFSFPFSNFFSLLLCSAMDHSPSTLQSPRTQTPGKKRTKKKKENIYPPWLSTPCIQKNTQKSPFALLPHTPIMVDLFNPQLFGFRSFIHVSQSVLKKPPKGKCGISLISRRFLEKPCHARSRYLSTPPLPPAPPVSKRLGCATEAARTISGVLEGEREK